MYSHDLLRYVDPHKWLPSPQFQKAASAILTELEEIGMVSADDSAKAVLVIRLTFEFLAPGTNITQTLADLRLHFAKA